MLERIISTYHFEYNVRQGLDESFDKIFIPEAISSLLSSYSYDKVYQAKDLHRIIKTLNKDIVQSKERKKDFTKLFAKNFLSLELLDLSSKLKYENIWLKNLFRQGILEHEIGHELNEQDISFAQNFLKEARFRLEEYRIKVEDNNDKDLALPYLAAIHLERAFDVFKKFKNDNSYNILEKIKEQTELAFILIEKMNNLEKDYFKRNKFHKFLAGRIYNFVGYTKKFLIDIGREDIHFQLNHYSHRIHSILELEYPYKKRESITLNPTKNHRVPA